MSKTLFKVLATAYLRHRQQRDLFQDCLAATAGQIQSLRNKLTIQISEIKQILSQNQQKLEMSIINQQQSQRSQTEQPQSHQACVQYFLKQFNKKIKQMKRLQNSLDQLVNIYKQQLKKMAESVYQWQQKNNKMKKKLQQKKYQNQQLKLQLESIIKQNIHQKNQHDSQQKQNSSNKVNIQQKNKWRNLSAKVQTLRKKIQHSQNQIQKKDQIIKKLNDKIKQLSQQDQEKKKLKSSNTTLRGQKMVLTNQLATLKKQIFDKTSLTDAQQLQIKKLRVENDNLASTLKWQINTIDDLRTNCQNVSKCVNNENNKIQQLQNVNKKLLNTLTQQQQYLETLNKKLLEFELAHQQQLKIYGSKIKQLQIILQQKNQSIIKLKSNSIKTDNSYYSDLVKVLTKKVNERDQIIKVLKNQQNK